MEAGAPLVGRVDVGMAGLGFFPIGSFDLLGRRVARDAQDRVVRRVALPQRIMVPLLGLAR